MCVTQGQLSEMISTRLYLQEAYTSIELNRDIEILIIKRHNPNKSGLVSTDLCNVAVTSVAEFRMTIATILRLGSWTMEGLIDLSDDGDECVD